jgi:hypothetical protein
VTAFVRIKGPIGPVAPILQARHHPLAGTILSSEGALGDMLRESCGCPGTIVVPFQARAKAPLHSWRSLPGRRPTVPTIVSPSDSLLDRGQHLHISGDPAGRIEGENGVAELPPSPPYELLVSTHVELGPAPVFARPSCRIGHRLMAVSASGRIATAQQLRADGESFRDGRAAPDSDMIERAAVPGY